ncbi:MAG TPA: HesA/MoeB/ThiF family protein [Planctomycetota bacterium]|nr:HesA/MoeB/ThiF family protein [Planctomycetota bacterium]
MEGIHDWQADMPGFGPEGQAKLRAATVLVSRIGGVGGTAAMYLAAAGVGRLVLAHAGNLRPSDLNRQVLMSHAAIGTPRVDAARKRLKELAPDVEVETIAENPTADNVERLGARADLVVAAAPLFEERLALNAACMRKGIPLVDAAMYGWDVQVAVVVPGKTACLACLYPEPPPGWNRRFPVFGAVAGTAGALGAVEAIKLLSGAGGASAGRLLVGDLRAMAFRTVKTARRPACPACG